MKKLTGIRVFGKTLYVVFPLMKMLYELQEVKKVGILLDGKEIVGCAPPEYYSRAFYEYFQMFGAKSSDPHLYIVEKIEQNGRKRWFTLTEFGKSLGEACYRDDFKEAKKLFLSRLIEKIPQFRCLLDDITKSGFIFERGRRKYFTAEDEVIKLDQKVKDALMEEGYDATCNPHTIEHFITMLSDYNLLERKRLGVGTWRYRLRFDCLANEYPQVYQQFKPPVIDFDAFTNLLQKTYLELSSNQRIFVPIPKLREKMLETLGWRIEVFDRVLLAVERANPRLVTTRSGPGDLLGKPLLGDMSKLLIKIEEGSLYMPKRKILELFENYKVSSS